MSNTFQFFSPEFQRDPFPAYAAMRDEGLSRIEPGGLLAISRHADVVAALRDPTVYSSTGFVQAFEPPWVGYNPGAHTMLSLDPPEHGKLRALVSRAFIQSVIERTRPFVQGLVDAAVDRLVKQPDVEAVSELATPITAGTIGHFLSLDPALHGRSKAWCDALASVTPTPMGPDHEARVHTAIREMTGCLSSLAEARRSAPGDDLVSLLISAEVDGQRLAEKDLVAFLFLLLVAGLETTVNLLSKSLVVLSDRPELMARLRAQPALVARFVEEMLRYDPPTHSLFRFVTRDTAVAGHPLPAGSVVMLMLAAANRDARQFSNPDVFDLDREATGSVAFGAGAHQCIGMALARLEARLCLTTLVERVAGIERVDPEVAWNHTFTVRGPSSLRLRAVR